jgi:uncharacterized LabA/DUF88 family protein
MTASTAILVDGGFFLRRYRHTFGELSDATKVAQDLFRMCLAHLANREQLYRILFYDCPPLNKKAHRPVSGRAIDFSKTDAFHFRSELHRELVRLRKVAVRRGRLSAKTGWTIRPQAMKALLSGSRSVGELTDDDFEYSVVQKGVDMRIGLDIASMAHKRLVQQIVLVTGDSDFVPAAKFARREGLDVVLDPMWQAPSDDLLEHVDGLRSTAPKPR